MLANNATLAFCASAQAVKYRSMASASSGKVAFSRPKRLRETAELEMLLQDQNAAAALRQRRRRGESTDPGADDDSIESGSFTPMSQACAFADWSLFVPVREWPTPG